LRYEQADRGSSPLDCTTLSGRIKRNYKRKDAPVLGFSID
jgi:hypothetical protein